MINKLKIGLIGLGRLGNVYGSHLAHHVPNADLAVVADIDASLAKSFAKNYDVKKWYHQYSDLIDDHDIDAVAVITPTSTHKEVVVEGKIISVEYLGIAEGYYSADAFKLNFDNGESYTIMTWEDTDFTVNSKFIMKLFWDGDDDYWTIESMYKVPSED